MKYYDITNTRLADTAADSAINRSAEQVALESHLQANQERYTDISRIGATTKELADLKLQMARTMVSLERGDEAWSLGREALDIFIEQEDFESAADACDVLFQAEQPIR